MLFAPAQLVAHSLQANSILYYTLGLGITLADVLGDSDAVRDIYTSNRTTIQTAVNELLWDEEAGWFNDNTETDLKPQDGNVWAILSGLTNDEPRITRILDNLQSRWTQWGPTSVEASHSYVIIVSFRSINIFNRLAMQYHRLSQASS